MSMQLGGGTDKIKSDINVTPLVDVMLVLLIIVMLIAPLLQQGVAVTLPTAENTLDKPETQEQTVIAITEEKAVFLNARAIGASELGERVKEIVERQIEKIVLIKADEQVDYSAVMAAMDQLRAVGIEDIGLITEKKREPGQLGEGGQ